MKAILQRSAYFDPTASRAFLALLACGLLGAAAMGQNIYTWANSNVAGPTPPAVLDCFAGGTNPQATWIGGDPRGWTKDTLKFFEDSNTPLGNTGTAGNSQTAYVNNGGAPCKLGGNYTFAGRASETPGADLTMVLTGDPLLISANYSYRFNIYNDGVSGNQTLRYDIDNDIQFGGPSTSAYKMELRGIGSSLLSFNGAISEGIAGCEIWKFGADTVAFCGDNSFSGKLYVRNGTLRLGGLNAGAAGESLILQGGHTILDLASGNDRWNTGSQFRCSGGTLTVLGAPTGTSSQTLFGPKLFFGQTTLVVDPNGGGGTTLTLGDTWEDQYTGALIIDLSRPGATLLSNPTLSKELIRVEGSTGKVVVKDPTGVGFGTVVGGEVVRYMDAVPLLPSSDDSSVNCVTSGTLTMDPGSHGIHTLKLDATTQAGFIDLNGTTLNPGAGSLMVGDHDVNIANGIFKSSWLHQFGSGTLTVASVLDAGEFTKTGPGCVALNASNTTSTLVQILDGVVRAQDGVGLPANATLRLIGGVFESHGSMTRPTSGASKPYEGTVSWTQINGAVVGRGGGLAAHGGTLTVNLNEGALLTWGSGGFTGEGCILMLGSRGADSLLDWQNDIDLNVTRQLCEIEVTDNPACNTDIAQISGVLSGTAGGLLKTGDGTLRLTAANTYAGPTVVRAGTLLVNGSLSPSASEMVFVDGSGALGGTGTVARAVAVFTDGSIQAGEGGDGELTLADDVAVHGRIVMTGSSGLSCEGDLTVGQGASMLWKTDATGRVSVGGELTLPTTASVKFDSTPPNGFVLFESANAIAGSSSGWSVTPSSVTVSVSANGMQVIANTGGSLIIVR